MLHVINICNVVILIFGAVRYLRSSIFGANGRVEDGCADFASVPWLRSHCHAQTSLEKDLDLIVTPEGGSFAR